MKKSRFTDSQILDAIKRVEAGVTVPEMCRELGIWSYQDSVDRGSIQSVTEGGHHVENQCSQQGKAGIQVHRIA